MAKRTIQLTATDAMVGHNPHTEKTKSTALDLPDDGFDLDSELGEEDFSQTITAEDVDPETLKEGKNEIALPLGRNGADVVFKLVRIPADELAKRVTIHPDNARVKEYFTELDRLEAKKMISEEGINVYPALGTFNKQNNLIELVDGFRRSQGCEAGGYDFQVYVSYDSINPKRASSLSRNANLHVGNGLLEKRHALKREIDSKHRHHELASQRAGNVDNTKKLSQSAIIKQLGIPRADYYAAIQSFEVSEKVWKLFPSPATLGRPSINTVIDYFRICDESQLTESKKGKLLNEEQRATVITTVSQFVAQSNFAVNEIAPKDANTATIKFFSKTCSQLLKESNPKVSDNVNTLPDNLGKVTTKENGALTIELQTLSSESMSALMAQLQAMIEDAN
ncbi:hypothetical protein [Vibrio agarivorans]|uniref:hypothetical protein n=1 Tax=Vibrio agarivorans TaxID=153622 RepID=UPI0025B5E572|nr:hypothetical protein [Vibrio agarivorans]MDN3661164.1 hypothetical protein [Vibrio agarivorans]